MISQTRWLRVGIFCVTFWSVVSAISAEPVLLKVGDPDRAAILKVVKSLPLVTGMAKDLGKDILMNEVFVQKGGEWAWFSAQPETRDKSWMGEGLLYLLRKKEGKWSIMTGIPEEVMTADDADAAYTTWRQGLLKKYPTLPAGVVPVQ
ncbi:hypothetical protein FEM03_14710 [Phragmitibacter flavus]|uniref:Uncharacterized protein n=1 Tax=Phragmitibacter flavus TaxID=2576071 RepID=A0A5R8KCF0_9BACT|nr:hypothetical protein [Phragmitibacter flavus]TLD69980.1 hypothetical protein FEM03_14710 [Phragmitibacter flavus]